MTTQTKNNHGILKKFLFFLKFLEIRLRFVLILVITALTVGYWDNIQNYYERWQRNRAAATGNAGHDHAQAQTETDKRILLPDASLRGARPPRQMPDLRHGPGAAQNKARRKPCPRGRWPACRFRPTASCRPGSRWSRSATAC